MMFYDCRGREYLMYLSRDCGSATKHSPALGTARQTSGTTVSGQ